MKQLSNRGAARIGAVWMIVVIVMFFVALAFAYIANQEAQLAKENRDSAIKDRDSAVAAKVVADEQVFELSRVIGFRDETDNSSTTDVETAREGISSLRDTVGGGETDKTYESIINPTLTKVSSLTREIASLKEQLSVLQAQVQTDRTAASDAASDLRDQIRTLETEKDDERQKYEDQIASLEDKVETLTSERDTLDDDVNDEKAKGDELKVAMSESEANYNARTAQLANQLEEAKVRATTPDGKVTAVSEELGLAWINRGSRDRLAVGMHFDIKTGHPNPKLDLIKGRCEVISVKDRTAEVKIYGLADAYDPIVQNDLLYNPIYDPDGERYAVLAGRFAGSYNEAEITLMLNEIGITVQPELDLTTNYLIVGQPMYTDENGVVLPEPRQPSDLTVYKDAVAQGCSVITIEDFKQFFKR